MQPNSVKVGITGAVSQPIVSDEALREITERVSFKPVEDLHRVLLREVESVRVDPRLSGLGRAEHAQALVEQQQSDINKFVRTISAQETKRLKADSNAINVALADENRLVAQKMPETDRLLSELRAREIRDALRAVPVEDRERFAMDAADENDIATLRAIYESPRGLPLLNQDAWKRVSAFHVARHYGEQVARRDEIDTTLFTIQANFQAARQAAARLVSEYVTADELEPRDFGGTPGAPEGISRADE